MYQFVAMRGGAKRGTIEAGRGRMRRTVGLRLTVAAILAFAVFLAAPESQASPYGPEYDAAFQEMLADPTDLDITFRFAMVARRVGDLEGAVGALERMLIYNPDLPIVHYELGRLYAGLGSIEAARRYYNSALSYAPPPDIRAGIEAQLERLDEASRASVLSGSVLLGFRHQTNANTAPDERAVRVGGFRASLADEYLEQEDTSYLASANLVHRYDFGRDPAVFLVSDVQIYAARQEELDSQDIDLIAFTTGPSFTRPDEGLLRPFLQGDWVLLDGRTLYRSLGIGVAYGSPLSWIPGSRYSAEAVLLHRDFRKNSRSPTVEDRDGENYRVNGKLAAPIDRTLQVEGFGSLEHQKSQADYETYSAVKLGARAVRRLPAPLGEGVWNLSLTGEAGLRDYDAPDRTVDPGKTRTDEDYSLAAGLTLPLFDEMSAILELRHQWRRSNLPNFEFDNTSALAGIRVAF